MLERKIWEFNHSIVCRILGISFDERELKKAIKKVEVGGAGQSLKSSRMHGMLMEMCANPNPGSKYLDKVLKKCFEPYRKKINGYDQKTLCRFIEKEEGIDGIPLSALIWFAVRGCHEEIREIEERIFAAIHMREHRALKFYDSLSRKLPDNDPEEVIEELEEIRKTSEKLWDRCSKLGRKVEQLRSEKETLGKEKGKLDLVLESEKQLNKKLKKDLENIGGNPAFDQIEILKKEKKFLKKELERLENINQSLIKQNRTFQVRNRIKNTLVYPKDNNGGREIVAKIREEAQVNFLSLQGRKVAFVGGLDSLVPRYRQMVKGMDGIFYDHRGKKRTVKKR